MNEREKITRQFEQKHLKNIKSYQKRLQKVYNRAIDKIFAGVSTAKLINNTFYVARFPVLKKLIDNVLLEMKEEVTTIMINGIDAEWELAEAKTDAIINSHLSKKQVSDLAKSALFTRRQAALKAFKERTIKGLDLSDRVWKYTNQFRTEIEQGLFTGISEGKSAAAMAQDQKQYLKEPDKLFRRIKDSKGKLVLSKAAKEYNPGQGVYRSSYKNALRTTRTETNIAYRSADNERYAKTKFILGFEVKLSANHPKYDICDHLKGNYPPSFKFSSWHPNCMCFSVPILPSLDEYDKYEDALLAGKGDQFQFKNPIKNVPSNLTRYVKDNREMLNRLKSKPYWLKDNQINV